ncbi:hypothetical protein BegalDRAFT_0802 [Beggiatoa alba B18LD]|uniref:Uncharacterized protein n=1 Tax=Beggiatoa alba B18LD TaxID=395493 RepID=I3CDM0_9GAMM|nr:hypothetical protein [Beggiatoa alba]EIJ41713.1 hypothetical protein BegalDRAFT_0802 [Beggiatoa alba B18LD]
MRYLTLSALPLISYLLLLTTPFTPISAADKNLTQFKTDKPYKNKENRRETLSIPNAEALEVSVQGITEQKYDYLVITDSAGNEQRFDGVIDKRFSVLGSNIKVFFRSDNATVADGVTVTIAPISLFKKVKFQVLAAANVIMRQGTGEINEKFIKILKNLNRLQEQLGQAQDLNSISGQIKEQLALIAQTYHDAASTGENILRIHQQQIELLMQLEKTTANSIDNLLKRQRENQDQITNFQNFANQIQDPLEKQKLQFSIEGTRNLLSALETQRIIWSDFQRVESELIGLLRTYSKRIEVLLYSMNISAQVYDQAVNVLALEGSKLLSLEKLNNINELQKIVADIQSSETAIMSVIKRIEQTDANF